MVLAEIIRHRYSNIRGLVIELVSGWGCRNLAREHDFGAAHKGVRYQKAPTAATGFLLHVRVYSIPRSPWSIKHAPIPGFLSNMPRELQDRLPHTFSLWVEKPAA